MLSGFHVADFGGQRRTSTTGKQQTGHHRAQLAQKSQSDHLPDRLLGAVATENVEALQRQHHANEQTGHDYDRQRQHADEIQLTDQQLAAITQATAAKQRTEQKQGRAPQGLDHVDPGTTEQTDALN